MSAHLHALLRALAFLTRLPPTRRAFTGDHPLGQDAHAFPVAGLLIALPGAVLFLLAHALGLSAAVGALAAIAATIALTGGLHEDGLADTADGLFGHHGRERALLIMKDSRVGTYGALALLLAVLARLVLLAEIVEADILAATLAFAGAHAASRGTMTHLWSSLPSADPGGLAASVGAPGARTGRVAIATGLLILSVSGAVAAGWAGLLLPPLLALLAHLAYRRWLRWRLGGQTGDTIGADQQWVEIAVLFGFALAL